MEDATATVIRQRSQISPEQAERFRHETVYYDSEQAKAAGIVTSVGDLQIQADHKSKIIFFE
jgi:hypothetical protein